MPEKATILYPRSLISQRSPIDPAALHITAETKRPERNRKTIMTANEVVTLQRASQSQLPVNAGRRSSSITSLTHQDGSMNMKYKNMLVT